MYMYMYRRCIVNVYLFFGVLFGVTVHVDVVIFELLIIVYNFFLILELCTFFYEQKCNHENF